ncbi:MULTISPECIES: heme ABC transporter ATP-binding protein [Streptacidiphilus]|uniref:Heme ABC transporter ATP-binding protein n=1 Tax=Streptacidiphilus cavernicola TaxID=3342716 RepID=A0ABV6USR7_9ACTN|nr:heme ABC transporter ATP-binding protein [Streptacidiphilus jeojiense]
MRGQNGPPVARHHPWSTRFARHLQTPSKPAPGAVVAEVSGAGLLRAGRTVLDRIDLRIRAGELLALLGPNGAGKSSLLALLAGDLAPTAGRVLLRGRPLDSYRPAELALHRALLPQASPLSFPFPAGEVVRMGRAPWAGISSPEQDDAAVARALAEADAAAFTDRPYTDLSGGERARVALARVLAQQAPLLLLDEPTAALDLRHQELVLRTARARAAAGDAVVVVLHDLGLAAAYADRLALLHGGGLAGYGTVGEVLDGERLSEVYGCAVEVLPHPRPGAAPLVLPLR